MLQTIEWAGDEVRLLDQTLLPGEQVYLRITDEKQMWGAIRRLSVRGAPAIGVAAALGVYLGVRGRQYDDLAAFDQRLGEVCDYLATSRPTAVNLFWALDRMKRIAAETRKQGSRTEEQMAVKIVQRLLAEALSMIDEDIDVCRRIGEHGLELLQSIRLAASASDKPMGILTHCNAGALAAVKYGTALAPIYVGAERGVHFHVYADETRPLLQGARITAFELTRAGISTTVLCDNMAATLMRDGKIQAVIVGTDRVAANGDVANKIGTLTVAILADHYRIPFFVAAPTSSIDVSLATGAQIPIEQRDASEVSNSFGKRTAPAEAAIYNPAFDVTPAELITAMITENGVVKRGESLADHLERNSERRSHQ